MERWPTNHLGKAACPCCGYHTLCDPPGSYDICPVCYWEEDCGTVDWCDMSSWGGANHMTIEIGRRNYEASGTCDGGPATICRPPTQEELPRYDWSNDPRPYWPDGNEK